MVNLPRKPVLTIQWMISLSLLLLTLFACRSEGSLIEPQSQGDQADTSSSIQLNEGPVHGRKITVGEYLRFDRYSVEEGLSQSTVFSILQDSKGYIWFGTEDGLNKFDGYTFTVYKNDPDDSSTLSSNWIQTMIEDESGTLWLGTRDGGINRYDQKLNQFTHYRHNPEDPSSLNDDQINSLYRDRDGKVWIGTGSGGLELFAPETGNFTHYRHDPGNPHSLSSDSILSIHQTSDGILWVGTNGGGLNRFDRQTNSFTRYQNVPGDAQSLVDNIVWSIFEDSSGRLWIGTNAGLDRLDRANGTFTHYRANPGNPNSLAHDTIRAIYEDRSGSLWIGTYGGGLDYFDPASGSFSHYKYEPGDPKSISSNITLSIFQDREGVLWFGTIGGGVSKLNLGRVNFTHYKNDPHNPNSLSNDMVRGFDQDEDGTIWIATMFGGLNQFDPQSQSWQNYRHDPEEPNSLSDDFVSAVYRDRSGVLWIGTIHGLDRFEPQTRTFTHFDVNPDRHTDATRIEVTAIYESREGLFWIGTTDGLYLFDRQEERWGQKFDFGLRENQELYVYIILEDPGGWLWIGTLGGGVYKFVPETGNYSQFQNVPGNPQSLSQNFVTAMFMDQTGFLWIGTNGKGFDRLDPATRTFTHYRGKDGLPNDSIYCMLGDSNGHLWVSTNDGLSRFDPRTERFTNYDMSDGLQSNEFNARACLNSNNGELIFGGINGFNVFQPENIHSNPVLPPIVITSVSKNNEAIDLEWEEVGLKEVILKWPLDSFEFEYAALSFAEPEKNQYAYYLDGFEETWKEVGTRRFGQYTNLPGGSYTLRVKGSNSDGLWNEAGVAVPLTVVPPFWQTREFFGVLVIAIISLSIGGYRLRVRNLEQRGRELEQQVEERTAELMQTQENLRLSEMAKAITEERNRLARDLHDSVTQSIYSLTLLAVAGQRMLKSGNFAQAEMNQSRLGEIAQQSLQEMRLLVYELRPQVLQSEGLVGALEHRLEAVERRAGITARMKVDFDKELEPGLEEELFHIAMEALNNALKHAKASEIVLSIQTDENYLYLTIADNGRGYDPDSAVNQGGMGVSSMTERAVKIGGSLAIQSALEGGTTISVSVPLRRRHLHSTDISEETS